MTILSTIQKFHLFILIFFYVFFSHFEFYFSFNDVLFMESYTKFILEYIQMEASEQMLELNLIWS